MGHPVLILTDLSTGLSLTSYLPPSPSVSASTPSPAMTVPLLLQENRTWGVPVAEHLSDPVAPLSDADLDDEGDLSRTGGAVGRRGKR